jgi:tyrosyl-tRNA synthetase
MTGEEVFVVTFPLLTTADGKKMGKTEKGAVFLDPAKTPVFEFYQYWRNVHDDDVAKFFKIFTFRPVAEIEALCAHRDGRINDAKAQLAWDVTALVHGNQAADQAQAAAQGAFTGAGADLSSIPHTVLDRGRIAAGVTWVDLIAEAGLAPSKREARQLVVQGGASVNEIKIETPDAKANLGQLKDGAFLVKAGKKRLFRFTVE